MTARKLPSRQPCRWYNDRAMTRLPTVSWQPIMSAKIICRLSVRWRVTTTTLMNCHLSVRRWVRSPSLLVSQVATASLRTLASPVPSLPCCHVCHIAMQVLRDGGFVDRFQVSWGSRLINPDLRELGADRQDAAASGNSNADANTFQVCTGRQ